jgi:hypothetical protein
MKIEAGEIYTIKLATGEEVVAKVTSVGPTELTIASPILCALTPQGLQMMPSLFSANQDKPVKLNNNGWIMITEPRDDVRNSWIQATTGIAPVTKQIITG